MKESPCKTCEKEYACGNKGCLMFKQWFKKIWRLLQHNLRAQDEGAE